MSSLKKMFLVLVVGITILLVAFWYWKVHFSVLSPDITETILPEETVPPETSLPMTEKLFENENMTVTNFRFSPTSSEFLTVVKISSSTPTLEYSAVPKFVSDWATNSSTVVINGGYFDEDNSPSGYLVTHGQKVGKRMFDQDKSGLITLQKGKLSIRDLDIHPIEKEEAFDFALQSYPFLLKNGKGAITQDSGLKARRTALGMDSVGNIFVLFANSSSLSLFQFMKVIEDSKLPLQNVLNLDGGPSSGIVIRAGEYEKVYNSLTPVPSILSFSSE